jgi:hypothetical protein
MKAENHKFKEAYVNANTNKMAPVSKLVVSAGLSFDLTDGSNARMNTIEPIVSTISCQLLIVIAYQLRFAV